MTQPDPTTPALYDAGRGGAIWDHLMTRTDGRDVAAHMVQALRESAKGELPAGMFWPDRALVLAFPCSADLLFDAVAGNVIVAMKSDWDAQVSEAEARGDLLVPA